MQKSQEYGKEECIGINTYPGHYCTNDGVVSYYYQLLVHFRRLLLPITFPPHSAQLLCFVETECELRTIRREGFDLFIVWVVGVFQPLVLLIELPLGNIRLVFPIQQINKAWNRGDGSKMPCFLEVHHVFLTHGRPCSGCLVDRAP